MNVQTGSATTYERMQPGHLDTVVAIEADVHAHPWSRGNFADSLAAGYHCWIARQEATIVGYAIVAVAAGEAHLLNLSVARAWQRRGIGGEITGFLLRLARDYGAERVYLEVRPTNAAARALYAAHGFVEIGRRRDYYPAGEGREDAVVMGRDLA